MERDKVKDLDDMSIKLGIPQVLFRVIVAYAIVYTKNYDMFTPKEMIYNLSKEALNRVDIKYAASMSKNDHRLRIYGKELVEEVAREFDIVDKKRNNL